MTTSSSSSTSTVTKTLKKEEKKESSPETHSVTLKLKKDTKAKRVVWTDDVVDNEFMNKKKSKKCCIYHKPKKFGESDSDSDSDNPDEHHHDGECDHNKDDSISNETQS
eukprot:TRINITY_DN353_c0_g1_i7.p1 TRINITY_DN353_c0_g1~~TRINITY_DN353_c0_g1_i7.p1  ORF type:complete len:109 (-),score=27.95 TRINITY_DN353_c0_g1_i7:293-619(-)